MFYYKKQEITH